MKTHVKTGLILFAHGSRDPLWRIPFESILEKTREMHTGPVALAFLECMEPSLQKAIDMLASEDIKQIKVIPLFLAAGSHVRKDLPEMIKTAQAKHPDISINTTAAIGEHPEIQMGIASFAVNAQNI